MKLQADIRHTTSGVTEERAACGNGTLMSVLLFAFSIHYASQPLPVGFTIIAEAGAIIHAHALPYLCSFFYAELVYQLTNDLPASDALAAARYLVKSILSNFSRNVIGRADGFHL